MKKNPKSKYNKDGKRSERKKIDVIGVQKEQKTKPKSRTNI